MSNTEDPELEIDISIVVEGGDEAAELAAIDCACAEVESKIGPNEAAYYREMLKAQCRFINTVRGTKDEEAQSAMQAFVNVMTSLVINMVATARTEAAGEEDLACAVMSAIHQNVHMAYKNRKTPSRVH